MKTTFSTLAEEQTLRIERINSRVSIRVRQCSDDVVTRDVMVDGYTYTPHVTENWLVENLQEIVSRVSRELSAIHIGMGQFRNLAMRHES